MCVNGHACGTVGNDVCGLWAVSYTHLDVYKRQALPLAPGEAAAAVSHQGIITLWQSRNEVMACLLYTSRSV